MITDAPAARALATAVEVYAAEITAMAEENRVDVFLVARPLRLPQPVQIIRRSTWDETAPPPSGHSRQDEVSRAWNLHNALYYKAGGVPWRLARNTADLTICYIGVSFYCSGDGDVLTPRSRRSSTPTATASSSVAARPGSAATIASPTSPATTRTPFCSPPFDAYRREHRTLPARVLLHMTSSFTSAEIDGFQGAADASPMSANSFAVIWSSDEVRRVTVSAREGGAGGSPGCR